MASGCRRKVLVLFVEDCEEVRALHTAAFEMAGMSVREAATIADARALLATQTPDLVVMDRELPDGDGFVLAAELKSEAATSSVPIIAFTATHAQRAMIDAHAAGVDGFVQKPCPSSKLVMLARLLLGVMPRHASDVSDASA